MFRFWPWLAASAAIHGLLLTGWLQLHRPTTAAGETVVIELLNIDSKPEHQQARAMPERRVSPVTGRSSQHAPVLQQPPHPLAESPVLHKTTPASSIQVATAAQQPAAAAASVRPVKTEPVTALPATKPRQIQTASATTAVVDEDKLRLLLRKHLESFKFYPASARRRNIEGDVDVGFTLTRDGSADQVTVLHGSGYAVLDHAALETVYRAQPFPVADGRYQFRLRFRRL
ncbi:energy transducer TonB [Mariprofundus ferrooxydans]|uniref:energy transducer TonB n=1 Tax=Mariprofundus ferrooxydans TaxID=314344 RepID=UPI00143186A2|nr:energy transducer TonB [Mariprofundus ferrooxydans]